MSSDALLKRDADEELATENRQLREALDAKLAEEQQHSPSRVGGWAAFTPALK